MGNWWRQTVAGVVAVSVLAACSAGGGAAPAPTTVTVPASAAHASQTGTATGTGTGTQQGADGAHQDGRSPGGRGPQNHDRSATADLAAFIARAEAADRQLRLAAALVNGNLRAGPTAVLPRTTQAVQSIDTGVVADAIPAGLDRSLMTAVLTVDSGLLSRQEALRGGYESAISSPPGTTYPSRQDGLRCLGNGAAAARRFAADLARLRTLAASHPALRPGAASAKDAVELEAQYSLAWLDNNCSDVCGGYVLTELAPISWDKVTPTEVHGSISQIKFVAVRQLNGRWRVELEAC